MNSADHGFGASSPSPRRQIADTAAFERIESDKLKALREYWLSKRGDRLFPSRHDIDPTELPRPVLPTLLMHDVLRDPLRFRYRLIGTSIRDILDREVTGRILDKDLYGENLETVLEPLKHVVEERKPHAIRGSLRWPRGIAMTVEAIYLPLGEHDSQVEIILAGLELLDYQGMWPPGTPTMVLDWMAC